MLCVSFYWVSVLHLTSPACLPLILLKCRRPFPNISGISPTSVVLITRKRLATDCRWSLTLCVGLHILLIRIYHFRLGCKDFTEPVCVPAPGADITKSLFWPDEAINQHPRYVDWRLLAVVSCRMCSGDGVPRRTMQFFLCKWGVCIVSWLKARTLFHCLPFTDTMLFVFF